MTTEVLRDAPNSDVGAAFVEMLYACDPSPLAAVFDCMRMT